MFGLVDPKLTSAGLKALKGSISFATCAYGINWQIKSPMFHRDVWPQLVCFADLLDEATFTLPLFVYLVP